MYKIVQGRVPPIPSKYSSELATLVQQMMARDADRRPTVYQILRRGFIRAHISMFLDRAADQKRKIKSTADAPRTPLEPSSQGHESSQDVVSRTKAVGVGSEQISAQSHGSDQSHGNQMSSARQRRRMSKLREVQSKKTTPHDVQYMSDDVASQTTLSAADSEEVDGTGPQEDSNGAGLSGDDNDVVPDVSAGKEVKELCVLLDSTLHLPIADMRDLPASHLPPSGRLADRVQSLRLECEAGLGLSLVNQVLELLNTVDADESEDGLVSLLGVKNFELFAARLKELKLCEDFCK